MEAIQTGGFNVRTLFKGRFLKLVKVIAIAAVAIAVISVGGYFIQRSKYTLPKVHYYIPANLTPDQQAQYLADHDQYQAALEVYQKELANTKDTNSKLNILFMMSSLASRFKDYSNALHYAYESEQLNPNLPTSYVAMAGIYQAEGNKNEAIKSWQQAINHLNPNQPGYNLIKQDYQLDITSLK